MKKKFTIRCRVHGESPGNMICRHLRKGGGLQYHAIRPFREVAPRVWQAWCRDCHAVLQQEGGWTDRAHAFADIKICCAPCYRQALQHHRWVPLAA